MTKWMRRYGWLFITGVALLAMLAFAACGDDDDDDDGGDDGGSETPSAEDIVVINQGDSVQVGVTAVLSGDLVALGTTVLKAAELGAQQLGDVEGFPVEIVSADDQCDASGAEPAAQQLLAEPNLVAVIGSICSGVNVTVQPTYEEANITQVSSGSTAVAVTHPEGRDPFKTFVRVIVNDGVQGVKQAEYAESVLGSTTVYIAHDTDAYGTGLAEVFEENYTGEVQGTQGFEKGQTDFASLVTSITSGNPDLVYVASFDPEAAALLTQLRTAGYTGNFMGGDGVITDQFLTLTGADSEGAILSKPAPYEETPELLQFETDYDEFAGFAWDAQPYAPESYDAYTVIFNALTETAKVVDGNLAVDLNKLNAAIRSQNFAGISGHIEFDENGDVVAAPGKPQIIFYKVENGAYVQQDFE